MNIRMSGLAIAVLALSATSAFADVDLTPEVKTKIEDMLKAQGYEVGKIKVEDGLYEAYVKKGDEKIELYLNEKLEIVKKAGEGEDE
ncbi:PepSY domain-containing protein [Aestuariivirga sp.]|jgi:hypothetical protein|uniref:PepSY domain-containing protein n=1 Tax=Aestuariivirga sp. TaxID=2650926 RepID=UPI003783900C